ncbi:hypothetical protein HanRHA438_Chr17g0833611 [Helianthus annuus]|nr:hypothetical protein HanRHA438_Chr17g0833611 [Helianthus annuus]
MGHGSLRGVCFQHMFYLFCYIYRIVQYVSFVPLLFNIIVTEGFLSLLPYTYVS